MILTIYYFELQILINDVDGDNYVSLMRALHDNSLLKLLWRTSCAAGHWAADLGGPKLSPQFAAGPRGAPGENKR